MARPCLSLADTWLVEAYEGGVKVWEDSIPNVICTVGLNEILDRMFKTATVSTPTWYFGLINNSPVPTYSAADTMSSHAGWSEWTSYAAAARPAFTTGTIANGVVDNIASKASFSISASGTLDGAFLTSSSVKGGTGGVLFAEGQFGTGDKVVTAATVLVVSFVCTASEASS